MTEVAYTEFLSLIFYYICLIAEKEGVRNIGEVDGLWEYQVDDNWAFKVNGHEEEVEGIPPFHALILYEGLPAGLVSPVGGIIASGAAVNEKNLIKAMKKCLRELAHK